jgi:hypothetical protein
MHQTTYPSTYILEGTFLWQDKITVLLHKTHSNRVWEQLTEHLVSEVEVQALASQLPLLILG